MRNYLNLLQKVLNEGVQQSNRTGIDTLTIPGEMLKFDLRNDNNESTFPAITTKRLAWKQVCGELAAFLRGYTSLNRFQQLGCNVWDQNALENKAWLENPNRRDSDDLGRIYGAQWRAYQGHEMRNGRNAIKYVDQIAVALDLVRNNPENRRILVNAWNPAELDKACLPPCHVLFQLLPNKRDKVLHMTMYQRSCDMFLGVPFNIASYALLLELFSAWCGYTPGTLTTFLADVHIYVNHLDQVKEQLSREPRPSPKLKMCLPSEELMLNSGIDALVSTSFLHPSDLSLVDYGYHPAIKAPMAV